MDHTGPERSAERRAWEIPHKVTPMTAAETQTQSLRSPEDADQQLAQHLREHDCPKG